MTGQNFLHRGGEADHNITGTCLYMSGGGAGGGGGGMCGMECQE